VAFAAETENLEANAKKKLIVKNADFIIANHVGQAGSGFESDNTEVTLLSARGERNNFGPDSKLVIAEILIERLAQEFTT
jgi:phosphopantothenoylcysteine decarboxylase/phosphopantothenate--cysteine ligase